MLLLGLYQQTLNSELKQLELIEVNFLTWWSEYKIEACPGLPSFSTDE